MSEDTPQEQPTQSQSPRTNGFRRKFSETRLAPDSAERQGRVARIAFEALGKDRATAFLNAHDDALGGRPLDLAVASAEGLAAVERAVAAMREAQ